MTRITITVEAETDELIVDMDEAVYELKGAIVCSSYGSAFVSSTKDDKGNYTVKVERREG